MKSIEQNIPSYPRRLFLKTMGILFFLVSIPASVRAFFLSQFPVRTVEKENFHFNPGTGIIEWEGGENDQYQLIVDGLVEKPKYFSYKELKSLQHVEQVSDFHCVEGWSVKDIKWGGFRFKEILDKVTPKPGATHAVFHSLGETRSAPRGQKHYIESFPIIELLDPKREILLVLNMDGLPLSDDHGSPLRLIAPYDLAYKSIKFITRIELAKGERPGWWTLANPIYAIKARVPDRRLRK